ncbi:MAG: DUF4830 domain-containing protein [Clostridia bacterium]|nr:DUF4830 domain-containing protein [Clostridia bacterium]
MKKMWLYSVTVAVIILVSIAFVAFANDTNYRNTEFLSRFGWEVSPNPIEKERFTLPITPDDIYTNYNSLQKEAGLDLTPYYGKSGIRYTYAVLNYPFNENSQVRANVLTIDGVPIAGDIMTVKSDGFMRSLVFPVN